MNPDTLMRLLKEVQAGALSPDQACAQLADLPFVELAEQAVTLDTHRSLRTGMPEAVFGEGKSEAQLLAICEVQATAGTAIVVTRLSPPQGAVLQNRFGGAYDSLARVYHHPGRAALEVQGRQVLVVSGGSSDTAVAREASAVARAYGARAESIDDVGVAGLHRLKPHLERLRGAGVLVVVAGMDGALPSVLAGLTGQAVIAVPSSVGYGASFGGVAALLAMLNSCAPGVSVVNIDNGYGAGYQAAKLARRMTPITKT